MGIPLTAPSPGINYNFVAGAYFVCSLILGILLASEKVKQYPQSTAYDIYRTDNRVRTVLQSFRAD